MPRMAEGVGSDHLRLLRRLVRLLEVGNKGKELGKLDYDVECVFFLRKVVVW